MKQHSHTSSHPPAQRVPATTPLGKFYERIIENPSRIRQIRIGLYVTLALLAVSDIFIHRHHAVFIWDHIPAFMGAYGLLSTILIIVISKFIGHTWLMKKEDYYE
jgi:hypothetical protein